MKRLIDANELKAVFEEKSSVAVCGAKLCKAIISRIDDAPTVEAIPIEWIVNYVNSYADKQKEITEDVAYIEVLGVIESMIADWRIENYGKTD